MNETLKKAILFGVGAFHMTKDRVAAFVKELEKEGALDPKEGEKVVKEVLERSEEAAQELRVQIEREVRRVLKEMNVGQPQAAVEPATRPMPKKAKTAKKPKSR